LDKVLHQELLTCLRSSAKFLSTTSFREQFYHICDILGNDHRLTVHCSVIAKNFSIRKPTIRGHYKNRLNHLTTPATNSFDWGNG
jgi:hypothetical protein